MKRCPRCMEQYDDNLIVCPYCLYEEDTQPEVSYFLRPGTVIGNRYLIGEAIGSGGFGITYVGWDDVLDQKVAIKEYFPSGVVSRENCSCEISITGATEEEFFRSGIDKFLDEARIINTFGDTPGIVRIYNFLEENNTAYIIMEYVEGVTLEEYIDRHEGSVVPWEETVRIAKNLLEALEKVHSKGIIHRDISPANIMISDDGTVKLIDFGAARQFIAGRTQEMSVIIKKGYAPVEQYKSDARQDEKSDIYSLGAVIYRMITGQVPVDALNRLREDKLKRPGDINGYIPEWLEIAVVRAMNPNPYERFSSAKAFRKELEDGEQLSRKGSSISSKRKKIVAILLFGVLILTAVIVGIAVKNANDKDKLLHSNLHIDCPDTIVVHEGDEWQTYVNLAVNDYDLSDEIPLEFEVVAEVSDDSIADVKVEGTELTISGKKTGKTELTLETEYASKGISLNVKAEEKVYPDVHSTEAVLEVGKDIPAGEYVAFTNDGYGYIDVRHHKTEQSTMEEQMADSEYIVGFRYNDYIGLKGGEFVDLRHAYLVPAEDADVDISGEGTFKVGCDIEEGLYNVVHNPGRSEVHTFYDPFTRLEAGPWNTEEQKKVYLSKDNNRYVSLEGCHLEKCDSGKTDDGQRVVQAWDLSKCIVNGKLYWDYSLGDDKRTVKEIEKIAGDNKGLKNVLITSRWDNVYITIMKDRSATVQIPSGVVEKTEDKIIWSTLGKGKVSKNKDGNFTYKITKPDYLKDKNESKVTRKDTEYRFEQVSDTELHFYYDCYNMELVFER